jgi:signal transduction histidine kinase
MNRKRRLFGPLFCVSAALAILTLLGRGVWEWWPAWNHAWRARTLARDLRDPDPEARRHASIGLAQLGPASVPWLLEAARDQNPEVRASAYQALALIALPPSALPMMRAGFADSDARVRNAAADYLTHFRLGEPELDDDLISVLNDQDADVRFRAARALWRRKSPRKDAAIQALIGLAGIPVVPAEPGRFDVIRLIQKISDKAGSQTVSVLIPLIEAKDPGVRREAVECLAAFGPQARPAIPSLQKILTGSDRVLRCLAAAAIAEIEGWDEDRIHATLDPLFDDLALDAQGRQSIDTFTESKLGHGPDPEYVRSLGRWLEKLRRLSEQRADRLSQRVDDALALTGTRGYEGAIISENLELVRLLEEVVAGCAPAAELQGCRLELRGGGLVTVRGDRALLTRAFENILRNAILRARAGTAVEVEVSAQRERATVAIRDHGPGLARESLTAIFEPYYPVVKKGRGVATGPDLRLAIARRAIELNHGTIAAADAGPGLVVVTKLACSLESPGKPTHADRSASTSRNP